jgi:hypothetical protein
MAISEDFSGAVIRARNIRSRSAAVNLVSFKSSPARSSLRVMAVAALAAMCASMAGCASDTHTAGNTAPWAAVGNNGGKADRYAIARAAASSDASVQVASGPAANRAQ